MSDYTPVNDFSQKDLLTSGDPDKVITGSSMDAETAAIQTAVNSKYDSDSRASQAQAEAAITAGASNDVIITPLRLFNWANDNDAVLLDFQALTAQAADTIYGWDTSAGAAIGYTLGSGISTTTTTINIDHDAATNFVANEHIDHTSVSISAGTGLSGGGTIAATRTLNLSHLGIESLADPNADRLLFWDDSETATGWLTLGTGLSITTTTINLATASTTVTGAVELATSAETYGGTDTGRAITPDGLGDTIFAIRVSATNSSPVRISGSASTSGWSVSGGGQNGEVIITHSLGLSSHDDLIIVATADDTEAGAEDISVVITDSTINAFQVNVHDGGVGTNGANEVNIICYRVA